MTDLLTIDPAGLPLLGWRIGWALIGLGFASGAVVGLFFHRADFAGGYGSWRRRLVRLAHVAFVALGMLNLLHAAGLAAGFATPQPVLGTCALALGGLAMPLNCLLAAWRPAFRHLFALPVGLLALGAGIAFLGTLP